MSDAIKLKVLPKFPAKLTGRAGIDVTKQNGEFLLDLDFADFPVIASVPAGTTYALIFDPATGKYAQLPVALFGGSGSTVYVSDTPPVGAADSSLWFESDSGRLFVRMNDGTSTQWVSAAAAAPSMKGTVAGDNAAAGDIGEYVESVTTIGSAVSMTTGTQRNITSITLSPGDWDVTAMAFHAPAATTTVTRYAAGLNVTSGVIGGNVGSYSDFYQAALASGGGTFNNVVLPNRFNITATTTIYLVGLVNFAVSTLSSYGIVRARRMR
ncbi:hypothetical protein [Bradyrhizobium sp. SEMIA]|uniref:hypothetical protein n=1 Tax=Bradyrhizobium sp. SEMIA TaxID=2597515 RepID=UPI0018A673E5|nr:hypothetical protein [Bradyrhizobium sp. SEMIA]QOG23164.1 hypothetical protein FOM02_43870 [Bradyrhizobium sp. SEMIA]